MRILLPIVMLLASCAGRDPTIGAQPAVPRPNLTLDVSDIVPSMRVIYREHDADACEVTRGCVDDEGIRALLSFTLVARNIGDQDATVGGAKLVDGCGGQVLEDFVSWQLIDRDNAIAAEGALDVNAFTITAGGTATLERATCGLPDVTDVPAGD